jgi:tellurite resistance protein TerC
MELLQISPWAWAIFIAFVSSLLLLDLLVFSRKTEAPTIRKAAIQSLAWIGIGILTGMAVWLIYGGNAGAEYFTGYVIEKSLSVDNIFVWSVVLGFFAVPRKYQHRVLFWGIFGALVMRFIFIVAGVALIESFAVITLALGALLIWSGLKLLKDQDDDYNVAETKSYKFFTKYLPTTKKRDGAKFFSRMEGPLKATPLFLCLLVVEVTDVIFAVDSVPAILAVARDPFIIFASNAMAILGLRALYFLFDAIKDKFNRLNQGLAIILSAVGIKMIASFFGVHIPVVWSLIFIATVLAGSVYASVRWPKKD